VPEERASGGLLSPSSWLSIALYHASRSQLMYCNRTATELVQASTQRTEVVSRIAKNPLNKPSYRSTRTDWNQLHRIVALEKVAGSIPVGHPLICR
jgi:hypothetical protein